ncbi:hypothetical protein CRUP_024482 [Coryphaenoides rupestris]|nr:hypothetical protein CRUP_024482 [Coryphaenoides rupestris]
MVKVSFNSALAQKDAKKDVETLIPEDDKAPLLDQECFSPPLPLPGSHGPPLRTLGQPGPGGGACGAWAVALMLSGLVVGGAYLYRYYILEEGRVFVCGVKYREEHYMDYMVPEDDDDILVNQPSKYQMRKLEESVRVLEKEQVALINVPVPEFQDTDPAEMRLTAYLDLNLNKCYMIPLNTSVVMPPKDLLELLENIKLTSPSLLLWLLVLGGVCGMQKREALNCFKIRHFESHHVMETSICEL